MERTYYTLADIRKALVTVSASYDSGEGPYALNNKSFSEFLNDCLKKVGLSLHSNVIEGTEASKCFHEYIWPRFYKEFVVYVDSDESEDFTEKFAETKVGQIFAWWLSSVEKYSLLIHIKVFL